MVDNRFPTPGTDERFPSPGTDDQFPSPGTDAYFPSPGVDARFNLLEDTAPSISAVTISPSSGLVGQTFTATIVGIGYPSTGKTFQWELDGTPIGGATSPSYTTVAAGSLTCVGSWDNGVGAPASLESGAVTVSVPDAVNDTPPTLTGAGTIGSLLTGTDGGWTGASSFAYEILRDGTPIATTQSYTPVAADDGTTLSLRVTAQPGGVTATSAGVAITYAAPVAVGTITAKTVAQDSVATYDASGDFTGTVSTWSITDGAATVNSSGLITFTTTGLLTDDPVTVQASNSGGADTQTFNLSVVVDPVATISSPVFSEGALAFNVDGAATVYAILSNDPVSSGGASSLTGSEIKAKQQAGVTGTVFAVATGAVTDGANSISVDTSGVPVGERVLHIATENGVGFDTAAFEVLFEAETVGTNTPAGLLLTLSNSAPSSGLLLPLALEKAA